jgi:hypothetical protein
MEDLEELYSKFEGEAKSRSARGEKAEKYRNFVRDTAAKIGKDQVLISAMFNMAKKIITDEEKIDRSYFNNVCEKSWVTFKDDKGAVYIDLTKPKTPKSKAE